MESQTTVIQLAEKMLEKKVWAVVGANQNPIKYGNMIYNKLKSKRYQVFPVNPVYDQVEGDQCYPDLASLPQVPDVIDMVVSPKRGKAVIEQAAKLGVPYIWFQPETYNDELLEYTKKQGLEYVKACVLVAVR